jgi:hypothetical protein
MEEKYICFLPGAKDSWAKFDRRNTERALPFDQACINRNLDFALSKAGTGDKDRPSFRTLCSFNERKKKQLA